MNPQTSALPDGVVLGTISYQEGIAQDATSSGDAISQAVATAEASLPKQESDIENPLPDGAINLVAFTTLQNNGPMDFASTVRVGSYQFFGYSATCFLQVFWDEVLYNANQDGTPIPPEISRVPMNHIFDLTGVNGTCLPDGFDINDSTTWPSSDEFDVDQPTPPTPPADSSIVRQQLVIENFVWSQLAGYTPPKDGSANGFAH